MSQEAMTDASGKKLEKKEANLPSELTAMFEATCNASFRPFITSSSEKFSVIFCVLVIIWFNTLD